MSTAICRDGQYLLVQRGQEPAKGLYAFPGGKVRPGENLEAAARREAFEETGLTLGKMAHFCDLEIEAGTGHSYHLAVFVCADSHGDALAGDDAAALGWYKPSQMADLPMTQTTVQLARNIAAQWPIP